MKKYLTLITLLALLLTSVFSIGAVAASGKLQVVTTIFPIYDWTREIAGDKAKLTMLLDSGVDLHSYQPTAADIMKIATCDVFIYVGGESDEWVEGALAESVNPNMKVLNLVELMGSDIKMEEIVEGMEHNHEHEDGHEHDEEVTVDDIQARGLSDFAGEWNSLHPLLMAGELDAFLEHKAEDDENATKESMFDKYAANWACDAVSVTVEGSTVSFTDANGKTVSAEYSYAGFTPVYNADGEISAVRYQYETDSADAPKYVQFNDHGHESGKAEHFHLYFGSESFEALMGSASNSYFAPAELSTDEILEMLTGGHDHGHEHDHEHEEDEADEHVWLSLRNAQKLTAAITAALCEADPANADEFKANAAAYIEKLSALDEKYTAAANAASVKTVLFGDRFPFRYMADDYGLSYYAAFSGCSAESEASFETIAFLVGKVDELGLPAVLTIEGNNHRIAETIVISTKDKNQKILTMDSMQSTTGKAAASGVTYLSVMEANLAVLTEALQK